MRIFATGLKALVAVAIAGAAFNASAAPNRHGAHHHRHHHHRVVHHRPGSHHVVDHRVAYQHR